MSLGAYDDDEHERRERKTNLIDVTEDDTRTTYRGSIHYDSGDSTEDLLTQFEEIKAAN